MLADHEDMWPGRLEETKAFEHKIELKKGARLFKAHPYRAGPKQRELQSFETDRQLRDGIIEPACSEWEAPVMFVTKKDGKLCF